MSKYNLHRLGWKNFENLCGHIMQNVLGSTYTPFSEGKDGGRDGFFEGSGNLDDENLSLSGKFVFQCKFTSKTDHLITQNDLKQEIPKVKRLVEYNEIDHYIIFTNYKLTAGNHLKIENSFMDIEGLQSCLVLGNDWIEMTLDGNKNLRKLVPRLYGIGDLSEILDERVYQQSLGVVEELKENVSTFVITKSYREAIEAVNHSRFVMLLGQPASGKTAIATNIAMTSIIEDQLTDTFILENPTQFKQHWNPHNPNRLFWFDDVFGATNLDHSLVSEWQRTFPKLRAAINKGAKVIFTSRDYIFNEARNIFKENSFPLLFNSQVVINVEELSLNEKQQILYNHVKSGDLAKKTKGSLKPYLNDLSKRSDFSPELSRRLGNRLFHKKLMIDKKELSQFFSNPSGFFEEVINNLDNDKQAAMILILIHNNQLTSPVREDHLDNVFVDAFNISLSSIKEALDTLKNSLVKLNVVSKHKYWSLYHPSMLDSLHIILSKKEEMLELYVMTVDIDTLVRDTTFKEESDKIFIPYNLWHEVTKRILSANKKLNNHNNITRYLLREATDDYLRWLWESEHTILEALVSEPSYHQFSVIYTYEFAFRLQELGLLKDNWIKSLKIDIQDIAVLDRDLSFMKNKFIMSLIDEETKNEIIDVLISKGTDYFYEEFDHIKSNLDNELKPEEVEEDFENWFFTANYLVDVIEDTSYESIADDFRILVETAENELEDIKEDHSVSDNYISNANEVYDEIEHNMKDDIFSDVDK
ncbi:hypothetical protein GCM10008983_01590 [Lentibacillus halophilus]|uniref:Novel STAND NTPase 3 domain-containing protein n=1 Tax=Lentibacillus halophilus TaxID=295065 RepID=A0ABN0Z1P5_9BACI